MLVALAARLWVVSVALATLQTQPLSSSADLAIDQKAGDLEVVHEFRGAMPTGVAVSRSGRVFVNYPRWGDSVEFTVAEIVKGREVPFPDAECNRLDLEHQEGALVSVQSVVLDPNDRLWMLDTGSIAFGPTNPGGPKLVCVDLESNAVLKTIVFPPDVALPSTYLNDVRFDLRRGAGGMAFITDSSDSGPNGIIVVDLQTGKSWRRLHDHPSTKAEPTFLPIVEGRVLMKRAAGEAPRRLAIGSDGIAIDAKGERLFYCPLASRHLYSVSVDALVEREQDPAKVAATVVDHGEKGASDGLESDAEGRIYVTCYEHNAILRWSASAGFETLVHDPRLLWPDTLCVASDGALYVTANQLHRQPGYHSGRDLRVKPYFLFRIPIEARPVSLK